MTTSHRTPARSLRSARARATSLGVLAATATSLALVTSTAPASAAPAAGTRSNDVVVALLGGDEGGPSARAQGRDGRLGAGCQEYPVRYAVDGADDDWLLELVVSDRTGEEVASVSLHGVDVAAKGRTEISLCRASVRAGRFSVDGVLTERAGYEQVEHPVEGDTFWLKRG